MSDTTQVQAAALPAGRWRIDPTGSELGFTARGMWGLATVRGAFREFAGTLEVDGDGAAHGTLEIAAASLDTGNDRRDTHLRSPDFFDAENHPTVTFSLDAMADGQLRGVLVIGDTKLPLDAPLAVELVSPEHARLSTELAVDREAAGVGWSKMGMIRGKAQLNARVNLEAAQSER